MTSDYIYTPAPKLTRWQRYQVYAYGKYGVDAGNMVSAMVVGFVTVVVLGITVVVQL